MLEPATEYGGPYFEDVPWTVLCVLRGRPRSDVWRRQLERRRERSTGPGRQLRGRRRSEAPVRTGAGADAKEAKQKKEGSTSFR